MCSAEKACQLAGSIGNNSLPIIKNKLWEILPNQILVAVVKGENSPYVWK